MVIRTLVLAYTGIRCHFTGAAGDQVKPWSWMKHAGVAGDQITGAGLCLY